MNRAVIAAVAPRVPDCDAAIAFYSGDIGFLPTRDEDQGHKRRVRVEPQPRFAKVA